MAHQTTPSTQETPSPAATGTVVNAPTSKELSGGARAGIGVGIGVGNICCGPMCYACPTILSSAIGLILYFSWKNERPQTAKSILTVTLITGGIALGISALFFAFGVASALLDSLTNY